MSQNYYDLYLNATIELAETLVVKSEYSALRLNQFMFYTYGPNSYVEQDPRTWKYYLNLAGEYHPLDEEMTITSLDTLQTIIFSKENLAIHTATAKAYEYNTRYYRELVTKYPDYEQLILGILYPCDLDTAIAAPDFAVLSYPPHLVEHNEASLIRGISEWVEHFNIRWNNRQFVHSDDLYGMALLVEMYGHLPALIWNLRLKACRTNEAHSFHVREYLASHGMLDQYMNYLTHEQTLFFYRNILWIERNAGRMETFEWLMEKVMTLRGLPLSAYSMHHNAGDMPDKLLPRVDFKKRLLNEGARTLDKAVNYYTLDNVLDKEEPLALGNREYRQFNQTQMLQKFENSLSNVVGTKILESSMIDYTDAVPYTQHAILLNHWIYMSQRELYNVYVQTKNPRTGEYFSLHVKHAYVYFLYAFCKSMGITLTTVPKLLTLRIPRSPKPTVESLMEVVDTRYVSLETASIIRNTQPPLTAVSSVSAFKELCEEMHDAAMLQNSYIALQEHMYTRGLVHGLVSRLYADELLPSPAPNKPYTTWMSEQNFPYDGFTAEDWADIYKDLYEQCTGYKMSVTENISNMQKAMVRLMEQLSSYSVQFVSEINGSSIKVMNWAAVRLGDLRGAGRLYYQVVLSMIRTINRNSYSHQHERIELDPLVQDLKFTDVGPDLGHWQLPVQPNAVRFRRDDFLPLQAMQWDQSYLPEQGTHLTFQSPLTAPYYAMTNEERRAIPSIYGNCFPDVVYPEKANLDDLVLSTTLPGLRYQRTRVNYLNAFQYYYIPAKSFHFTNLNTEVTLNAFYANYGDVDVPLALNTGATSVTSFSYVLDIPLETHLQNSETYSGGWTYANQFDPTLKTDTEAELTGLYSFVDQRRLTVVPMYRQLTITDWYKSGYGNATLPLHSTLGISSQATKSAHDIRDIGALLGQSPVYTANFFASNAAGSLSPMHDSNDRREIEGIYGTTHSASLQPILQSFGTRSIIFFFPTTLAKSMTAPWKIVRDQRTLSNVSVVRDRRSLNGFKRTTMSRSLPNFRLIMQTHSLNAFGVMYNGRVTLATTGIHSQVSLMTTNVHDIRTIVLTV